MNPMVSRLLFATVTAGMAGLVGCEGCAPTPDPVVGGEICGSGAINGTDYAIDRGELVITVAKKDAFGCGALHSHAVLATQATFTYDLDGSAAGEVGIVVAASGLDPDDPELRLKYLPDGENQALSDSDRESIRGSVNEEVLATDHPALNFTLKGLSTLDGAGSATLVADIAGATSESEVAYTATTDGDTVTVTGTATIDGAPHGIPRNALGFCVDGQMGLHFELVMSPGTVSCDGAVDDVPAFEETLFPDDACGEVGFNVVANEVIGPRCMGCHGGTFPDNPDLLRGGATVPLVAWEDFRVDSARNIGSPMYLKAHEYIGLDPFDADVLSMPPASFGEASLLQDLAEPITIGASTFLTEKDLFDAWVEQGLGRNVQCDGDVERKTFGLNAGQAVEPGACVGDVLRYDTAQPDHDGLAAADFFVGCIGCHADNDPNQAPSAAKVATLVDVDNFVYEVNFAAGELPVTHPFYVDSDGTPLSFWEASIHRTDDGSMSPGSTINSFQGDPAFEAFKAWVAAGYCPPAP